MTEVFTDEIVTSLDISHLIIEDDTPIDNLLSEKQQRLLTETLYSSWSAPNGQEFLAAANVAIFYALRQPPPVPDVFLSLNVQVPPDWQQKEHRSYYFWEFGKMPEVVIEIVSNKNGNELGSKLEDYARLGIPHYIVFDPLEQLGKIPLRIFEGVKGSYVESSENWLEKVGLGITLWRGKFEGVDDVWLRWCDQQGNIIPTGKERAEQAESLLEQERQRSAQLIERLRSLGVDPDLL
ncbi:MAG TPA: Uma2 family endonuclease [Nostocaceae cyanobacterium]|nr:Uma2 family endonuclease [Nostocaceae cyanobacterium]